MRRFLLMISLLSLLNLGATDYTQTEEFKRKIARVEQWRDLVEEVKSEEGYDFDTDRVMAIIAQESGGHPKVVSGDEHRSVGLMQCTPQPWTASVERLKIPKVNIQCGLWILSNAMEEAEGDWYNALRYYNCGARSGKKRPHCGAEYADLVLNFWLPYFDKPQYNLIPVCLLWKCLGFIIYDQDNGRIDSFWYWKTPAHGNNGDRKYGSGDEDPRTLQLQDFQ